VGGRTLQQKLGNQTVCSGCASGSPITNYQVTGGKPASKVVSGSVHKVVFKLKPGRYKFRVVAKNSAGWSLASLTATVRPR